MKTKIVKTKAPGKTSTRQGGPATDHIDAARRAQGAIKQDPNAPENYTALAGALRMLAQFVRERNPESSDNLLHLACAAAWELPARW